MEKLHAMRETTLKAQGYGWDALNFKVIFQTDSYLIAFTLQNRTFPISGSLPGRNHTGLSYTAALAIYIHSVFYDSLVDLYNKRDVEWPLPGPDFGRRRRGIPGNQKSTLLNLKLLQSFWNKNPIQHDDTGKTARKRKTQGTEANLPQFLRPDTIHCTHFD